MSRSGGSVSKQAGQSVWPITEMGRWGSRYHCKLAVSLGESPSPWHCSLVLKRGSPEHEEGGMEPRLAEPKINSKHQ